MSNLIEIRTHHVACFVQASELEGGISAYIEGLSIVHKIGTCAERKRFFDAIETLGIAISNGNFIDIGEKPDAICRACLDPMCPDSYASKMDKDEIDTRVKIGIIVGGLSMNVPNSRERHELICRKLDELFKSKPPSTWGVV